jgi:V8-like Glu-specific endopeptidase
LRDRAGEKDWSDARRAARPATKQRRPPGGLVLPRDLLKRGLVAHESFMPPEAALAFAPRLLGRQPERKLRTFSGSRVTPCNQTFFDDGNDERQLFFDSSYPWCCIGRIATKNGWGTATLAGRNFVITASHLVDGLWTPGQPLTESITWVPAMNGGNSSLGPTWSARVDGIAAWKEINDVVGYDLAICHLDQPMGDWLGYFGSRSYDDGWEDNAWWEHVGYPYDLSPGGVRPSWEMSITIDDDDGDDYDTLELETNADIASGQSGGPLWAVWQNGGNQIVGICSGNQDSFWETTNIFAGGNGLNSLVSWGRANW